MGAPLIPGSPEEWALKSSELSQIIFGKKSPQAEVIYEHKIKKFLIDQIKKEQEMAQKKLVDHWKCKLYRANGLLMTEHIIKAKFPPPYIKLPVLEKLTYSTTTTTGDPLTIPYKQITFKMTGHSYYKGEASYKEHPEGLPLSPAPYPNPKSQHSIDISYDQWKELEEKVAKEFEQQIQSPPGSVYWKTTPGKAELSAALAKAAQEKVAKAQNNRRRKRVFIPAMSLLKLVTGGKRTVLQVPTGMPEGTKYISVLPEPHLDGFSIICEHPEFDPIDDGEELPIVYMDFEDLPQ